jgi:dTDP-4-amino-4,6-dideoxygalactose transaminase
MQPFEVPFNVPAITGLEPAYLREAMGSGHLSGDGPMTERCHALLAAMTGAPRALLTTSCTHALELAALLLDLRAGDEVIVPSFTFVSTAAAFALRGAIPVFADIRPDTLNIDERQIEQLVTPRTRAIAVVHYAGVGAEMPAILAVARRHGLAVVEDNAHGLCGRYAGRALGSFGEFATLSFHETKNFTCGEGGALLINDLTFADRAEILREKGTDRSRFFRGQIDKYGWTDLGSSYLPSELLAAFLRAQLESASSIQARRRQLWDRYHDDLRPWRDEHGIRGPVVPAHCDHPAHLYYLLMPSRDARTALIAHLRSRSILAVFHYLPLHTSPMGLRYGGGAGRCPVTEDVSDRLVRLPLFFNMTDDQQALVMDAVRECPLSV